ncbi:MAG: ABC transporter permease [Myxococcales bacterium]|nr:ABC transporter permease [Myxococcales bacterium]
MSLARRIVRALWYLTGATVQRLLREGMVLRSMVWPGGVVIVTFAFTIALLAFFRPSRDVAITPDLEPALVTALEDGGFTVHPTDDPHGAVKALTQPVGTDGDTVWTVGTSPTALELEAIVRTYARDSWRPQPPNRLPDVSSTSQSGLIICRILAMLFVTYGAVFGLGSVARDRDDGSLEAELALPVPRWVGGFARWIASVLVLAVFYGVSVLMLAAIIGVHQSSAVIRHGIAGCGAGVALGLMVVGTSGLKNGFSGPFAAALTGVTALAALGTLQLTWLPVASLFSRGQGYSALAVSIAFGLFSSVVYARRTGTS